MFGNTNIVYKQEHRNLKMRILHIAGKYLDQPRLVSEFADKVPLLLTTGMGLYGAKQVCDAPQGKKKDTAIRLMSVLSLTGASALLLRRKPSFDKLKQVFQHFSRCHRGRYIFANIVYRNFQFFHLIRLDLCHDLGNGIVI